MQFHPHPSASRESLFDGETAGPFSLSGKVGTGVLVKASMAGAESGGFAFLGHIPERYGIRSGLYLLEIMAHTGMTPSQLVDHLFDQVGAHYCNGRDVTLNAHDRERIMELIQSRHPAELAAMSARDPDAIGGRRIIFEGGWLASGYSGTEPLLRIYAEAGQPETVKALLDRARG